MLDLQPREVKPGLGYRSVLEHVGGAAGFIRDGYLEFPHDPHFLLENVPLIKDGIVRMTDSIEHRALFKNDDNDFLFTDEVGWGHNSDLYYRDDDEHKFFFHCYDVTRDRCRAKGAPVEEYADFFMAMQRLNARAMLIARTIGELFDEFNVGERDYAGSLAQQIANGIAVTRILRYLPRDDHKPADAKVHIDRNCITAHWWSSRTGLAVFTPKGDKRRVNETAHDAICVFGGKKFAGATARAYGLGTPHGVLDSVRERAMVEDRFALVTFVHCALTPEQAALIKVSKAEFDACESACTLEDAQ